MPKKRAPEAVQVQSPEIASVRLPDIALPSSGKMPFLQGPGINMLSAISTTSRYTSIQVDPVTDEASLESSSGQLRVFLNNFSSLAGFKVSTSKLLDSLILNFTARNGYRDTDNLHTEIRLPLKEYTAMLGKDPSVKAQVDYVRRTAAADLETLFNISIQWTENTGRKGDASTKDYMRMRLFSSVGIKRGTILVNMSSELAQYLSSSYIMEYNIKLLTVSERFPSAYHLGRKMLQTVNFTRRREPTAPMAGILSVKNMLKLCPDLPDVNSDSLKKSRHYDRDIFQPFEAALNELVNVGFCRWEYCNAGGLPLKGDPPEMDYKSLLESYVRFELRDEPRQLPGEI